MSVVQSSPLPPTYSDPFADDILQGSSGLSDLPAYSAGPRMVLTRPTYRAVPKTFDYELKYKEKPLAVMTIIAEEAFSKNMPTFLERTSIKGRVKLTLDKPEAIQAIVVSAYGQVITGYMSTKEKSTFVDVSSTLWSPAMGNPRLSSTSVTGSGARAKFTSKLEGEYTWNFSLDLPKEVVVPSGPRNERQAFSLPQTFYERHTRVSVAYEVAVRIVRRSKLKLDHRIAAPFGYIPIHQPGPFSPLRRLAYEEGIPLLGPTVDPAGWYAHKPTPIQGMVLNGRSVKLACTLFLAQPLSYTKGSVIPIILLLESRDLEALDVLSSPKSIVVRLRRRIKYHSGSSTSQTLGQGCLAWRDAVEHSQLATWWPSAETSDSKRYINGELHLGLDVKPTSAVGHFRLEYAIALFPFNAVGYTSAHGDEPFLEQPVEITTAFGSGPRPMRFAPPEYEAH